MRRQGEWWKRLVRKGKKVETPLEGCKNKIKTFKQLERFVRTPSFYWQISKWALNFIFWYFFLSLAYQMLATSLLSHSFALPVFRLLHPSEKIHFKAFSRQWSSGDVSNSFWAESFVTDRQRKNTQKILLVYYVFIRTIFV